MQTGTGIHQFTLNDAKGQPHAYVVTEHPAGEGMGIMYELLGLGAPAVLSLAGAALQSEEMVRTILQTLGGDVGEKVTGDSVKDLGKMVQKLDLSKVGDDVRRALATGKAPDLTRKVLSRTIRDGQQLNGPAFEIAYQANYLELLTAVWRVCSINRFFPVPSTSSS